MPHRPRPQLPAQVMGPPRGSQRHSPACPRPQELQELQASRNGRLLPTRAKRAGKRPYERVYENIPVSGRQKRRARKQGGRRQPGKCSLVAVWQTWRECWGVGGGEGESEVRPGPGWWSGLSSLTSLIKHTRNLALGVSTSTPSGWLTLPGLFLGPFCCVIGHSQGVTTKTFSTVPAHNPSSYKVCHLSHLFFYSNSSVFSPWNLEITFSVFSILFIMAYFCLYEFE